MVYFKLPIIIVLNLNYTNKTASMIEQLKALQQYMIAHKMEQTLKSLRAEILSKYPQAPSQQFTALFDQPIQKKNRHSLELTQQNNVSTSKKARLQDKMKSQMVVENLLGKIAYSTKLLQDPSTNTKITKLLGNKIFQKSLTQMFPQSHSNKLKNPNIEYIESELQFKDELDLIQLGNISNENQGKSGNIISHIHMLEQEESSIVSQPSLVLEELNRNQEEDYTDDNDLGYFEFVYGKDQLLKGCSRLTEKYGYPQKALMKNTKIEPIGNKKQSKEKQKQPGSKFPLGVNFPNSNDPIYPREYNGIIYDILKLKVIFDRQKTGCEETAELPVDQGDVLAGRYKIESVLGSGVFAKVLKVYDLIRKEQTCLKMVSNNKDFFDQALDEIKLLRYINANCNPDEYNLLKFKGVFYHREHLFIETDLLKDNLFVAYRKNPAYFSIPVLKQIAKQILQALSMLHSLHIIHADLKPQNILIKSYNPIKIKVVDLGNSCFFHDHLGQYVQSRSYRAPQVVLGTGYDEKIDIWSVGCILAQLWTKNVLFYNLTIQGMLARIQGIVGPWPEWMLDKGTLVENYFSQENLLFYQEDDNFHILIPKNTSLRARIRTDDEKFLNLLQCMLRIDPHLRLSTDQALQHPFIKS